MMQNLEVRPASRDDLESIRQIYNEGIEDRVATLDRDPKSSDEMARWWAQHTGRFVVLAALDGRETVGWTSLNPFSDRCAHENIADVSVYVRRNRRGRGVGRALLTRLVEYARRGGFHKIVLHALNGNESGKRLYRSCGFREVGVFEEHGIVDGTHVDVVAMERLLQESSREVDLGRAGFEPA
ncbi:MAG TPA: arsinothricin resistance N-acetyltransferase ArsN1 family A [Candidatus Cybelea sp.]|nr:arsinothricin resistance N-acetyltransferase ArsN1 family A [Candidatus Cybelea sp.]